MLLKKRLQTKLEFIEDKKKNSRDPNLPHVTFQLIPDTKDKWILNLSERNLDKMHQSFSRIHVESFFFLLFFFFFLFFLIR
jgi:hypothetical protein